MNLTKLFRLLLTLNFASFIPSLLVAAEVSNEWQIPLGGNAYLTKSSSGSPDKVETSGITRWQDGNSVFSVFFRVDRPATLDLALRMKIPEGKSVILATVDGKRIEVPVVSPEFKNHGLGKLTVKEPGYVRVDLKGGSKEGSGFAEISDLLVESQTEGLNLNYVKDNEGNRFYWGRRGPSVHLGYLIPKGTVCEYFYNEVTIPEGDDPIGTYAMANGFGEGYFGMQVNSPTERRILFSVWSPFHTDDPKSIPEAQRIRLLAKGKGVRTGEFGNEGSGGQSFLFFQWKAGTTYRFLNRAKPDGKGNTVYTAWFQSPEDFEWKLVASFSRPDTEKHLTGLHSFLENFRDLDGYQGRSAHFKNQWLRDTDGKWHPVTAAKLTGDDIARRGYRRDFAGGTEKGSFFLRNGGFFAETVPLDKDFKLTEGAGKPPVIDFASLEAVD